jgi:hypothetical protein
MFQEHHQAIIPKALIINWHGRSSDLLAFEAFPSVKDSDQGFKGFL